MIVLDASALLAYVFREPGHQTVAQEIAASCLSTVNLCEVLSRLARDGKNATAFLETLAATPIEIVAFERDHALLAARLIERTHLLGLSLGDRACLALGLAREVAVLTADRSWLQVAPDPEVRLVR